MSVTLAVAQQNASHPTRIICTQPTMKVLKMVKPTYPPVATASHITGMVVVEVEIDKNGKPSSIRSLKGHPVLAVAVVEAVKQWRWKPLKLNGLAVDAVTTITVNFER